MTFSKRGWTYLGLFLALVGPGIIALLSNYLATTPETVLPRLVGLFAFALLLLSVLWVVFYRENLTCSGIGFAGTDKWTVLWALPLIAFFVFVFGPLAFTGLQALDLGSFEQTIRQLKELPQWYLILSIIIVAGGEEWLYRGYAIERLSALTGNVWLAGVISLLLFALVHLPFWGAGPTLTTLVSGLILTLIYIWKRDVLLLIIAHIATDLVGIVIS